MQLLTIKKQTMVFVFSVVGSGWTWDAQCLIREHVGSDQILIMIKCSLFPLPVQCLPSPHSPLYERSSSSRQYLQQIHQWSGWRCRATRSTSVCFGVALLECGYVKGAQGKSSEIKHPRNISRGFKRGSEELSEPITFQS